MAFTAEITTFTSPTSDGNQDITIEGFGTPKAAIVLGIHSENGSAETVDTVYAHVAGMVGWTDGTSDRSSAWTSEDAQANSDTHRAQQDELITQLDAVGQAIQGTAVFGSWITDGIRITWSGTPEEHTYILVLLGGTDISNVTSGDHTGNTALGYRPDLILTMAGGAAFETTNVHHMACVGAVWDLSDTQFSLNVTAEDDQLVADCDTYLDSDNGANQLYNSAISWSESYSIQDTGFNSSGISGDEVGHLALMFGGDTLVKIGLFDTATSTGTDAITGVGFQPAIVMLATSLATANDTVTASNGASIGWAIDSAEYSLSWADENDATTMNTQTEIASSVIDLPDGDGSALCKATIASMDSDGFTLNYATADGTARKGFYVAIGAVAAGGGDIVVLRRRRM